MTAVLKTSVVIRNDRRRFPLFMHTFILAAPWPKTGENLETLARTADALGACLAVPKEANATKALRRGNTIGIDKVCVHWIEPDPIAWLQDARGQDRIIIAVELAHGAIPLSEFEGSLEPVVIVLGNESQGIPQEALDLAHEVVEIPMKGVGNSLNVAVAGSLVAYKWAGWS